jgi:two-component system chemotaxis response regulator CheY
VALVAEQPATDTDGSQSSTRSGGRASGAERGSFIRILIVDDSATIRRMVAASLRGLGDVSFAEAASGLEAVERLAMGPTAMMVLDLTMPDMHGLDVLRFVRRHPTYHALPVIVLTTRDDPASRSAAMEAGATMYLTKPFVPDALASHARTVLAGAAP